MNDGQIPNNPLDSHLRYIGMTDADVVALRGVLGLVEQHADAFVEYFYAHLLAFEGTRKLLSDEATVRRLLTAQRKYLLSLFDARFDQEYYAHRRIIGQTHFRIGLDFQWYIGAYALYLDFFMPILYHHHAGDSQKIIQLQGAFRKAALLDMTIVLEAYHEGDRAALSAAQSQVMHQEKLAAVGLLASGLAHEIGNPLASIQAICENQLRKGGLDPQAVEKFQRIHNQVGRITGIVRQLVNFARRDPEQWKPVNINEELEAALGIAKLSRAAKSAEVRLELDAAVPLTVAIAGQLSQVFLNLFLNAFDAMKDEGGCLAVSSSLRENRVVIRVSDNGVGIQEEHVKSLFLPFFTTKEPGKGTGLGLHVCECILKRHEGAIRVESTPGQGATFIIELPVRSLAPREEMTP